jgi:8-oxo-dGTP diphosphatase
MENVPRVGVGVYILNSKKQLLLQHRTSKHAYGTWAAPGGHLEFGESFFDCAKREAKEETGIDVQEIKVIGVSNDVYKEEGKHYVTPAVRVISFSGEPKIMEPEKCDRMEWFDLDNLPSPLMSAFQTFLELDIECLCDSGKSYKNCHGKI